MNTPFNNRITYFARVKFRDDNDRFGIYQQDRLAHMYIIGKTGTGKSTLLETLMRDDLEHREGFAFLDPHGDLVERILASVPESRADDVIYVDVTDPASTFIFNPLERVPVHRRAFVASSLIEAFKKLWADSWGPRLEHILRNSLLTLLDQPEATLADVSKLLTNDEYRQEAITHVLSPEVRAFWNQEYRRYPASFRVEAIAPIQNKVGAFLANPAIAKVLKGPRSTINLRAIMDHRHILLVNLAKGKIGEDAAALLGSLLVTSLGSAAFSRADIAQDKRVPFYIYLDEFPTFTTLSLATMLSELRKYGAPMVLAHQYLSQMEDAVRDSILGNVGTIISFRLGLADAEVIAKEFYPTLSAHDLINLPNHMIYLKLMIDGMPSQPFSAVTELPRAPVAAGQADLPAGAGGLFG